MGKSYRRNDEYGNKYRGYRKNNDKPNKRNKNYRGHTEKDDTDTRWDFQTQEGFR